MPLLYIGDATFIQAGKEIWLPTPFQLDQLIVNVEGGFDDLDTYLDALNQGDPSDIDANMKLLRWRPSFPRPGVASIELNYIGPKGGVMPPGQHGTAQALETASASANVTGVGDITLTYKTPVKVYRWVSIEEGVGGLAVPPSPTGESGSAQLTGSAFLWANGSDDIEGTGTAFTSEVRVGDRIILLKNFPSVPQEYKIVEVLTVTDNDTLQVTATNSDPTFNANLAVVFHVSDLGVTVVSIRAADPNPGSILTGEDVDQWGPIMAAAYFTPLTTSTIDSEELLPGEFWQNTQRIQTSLVPNLLI